MRAPEIIGAARQMDAGLNETRALLNETNVAPPAFSARRIPFTSAVQVKGFMDTLAMEVVRPVAACICLTAWLLTMPGRMRAMKETRQHEEENRATYNPFLP